jgi:glycerol-3-phosphate acyltransferase PlsY
MFTIQLLFLGAVCLIDICWQPQLRHILTPGNFSGDDIRKYGSGNAGMTNMLRTYGKWPAVFTALGDFLKAVAAVFVARALHGQLAGFPVDAGYLAGIFVIVGHLFPLYFRFKGGKGVMTALGVLVSVNPPVFAIVVVAAVPLIFITRIVSIASISGALVFSAVSLRGPFCSPTIRGITRFAPSLSAR